MTRQESTTLVNNKTQHDMTCMTRHDVTRHDMTRHDITRHDMTRYDHNLTQYDLRRGYATPSYALPSYAKVRYATPSYAAFRYTLSYASSAALCAPNGTALPTRRPPHQSQRRSPTHPTSEPPTTAAQRHPYDANPNGTAHRTRSPRHSDVHSHQTAPIHANPKGTAHRAPRVRARTPAPRKRAHFKSRNKQGPAPRPPLKNENPSLRVREKGGKHQKFLGSQAVEGCLGAS